MDLSTFLTKVADNQYNLTLDDGQLSGSAVPLLEDAIHTAQFFVIGEEHGIAEIPQITSAIFDSCYEADYRHFCAEISPLMARDITRMFNEQSFEIFKAIARQDPLYAPFYTWQQDAELLKYIFEKADSTDNLIWGVDQEFMFTVSYRLSELTDRTDDDIRDDIEELINKGKELWQQNIPPMFALQDANFAKLRAVFASDVTALTILNELEKSFTIYHHYLRGMQGEKEYFYHNNNDRERLMKANFIRYYRLAQKDEELPKALLRFGDTHASRGLSPTRVYSLANFVSELAMSNGLEMFNILMVGGAESQARTAEGMHDTTFARANWLQPLVELGKKDDWALFDLRPLRPIIDSDLINNRPSKLIDLIWRYDALLILNNSTVASDIP